MLLWNSLAEFDDDLLWATVHRPSMIDTAFCQPVNLAAHRVRQTKCHRQSRRPLEGQAEADDRARGHICSDGQIGAPNENTVVINNLDKLDVCRRVIDLDNVERVVSPDVARSRL